MEFYDSLAEKYDQMTGGDIRYVKQKSMIARLLKDYPMESVLDVACGSGLHTIALAELGIKAVGIDLSHALLNIAEKRAREKKVNARFLRGNMLKLSERLDTTYDGVICLGNSLPHLTKPDEMKKALAEMFSVVKPGGVLVIQTLNYDRILMHKERIVNINRSDEHEFIRFYDFLDNGMIRFNVLMINWGQATPEHSINSLILKPYRSQEMISELSESGFMDIKLFEEPDFSPFDKEKSFAVTYIARKPGK